MAIVYDVSTKLHHCRKAVKHVTNQLDNSERRIECSGVSQWARLSDMGQRDSLASFPSSETRQTVMIEVIRNETSLLKRGPEIESNYT
jgi:hypothetical protein